MKKFITFFILNLLCSNINLLAQEYTLKAIRNYESEIFNLNQKVVVKFKKGADIVRRRGIIVDINDSAIVVGNKKRSSETFIEIEDIFLLRKINPNKRTILGITSITLIGGAASLIDSGGDSPGSAMRGAFLIPIVGIGVYALGAIPITIIIERLFEKKTASGWKFIVQNRK